MPNSLTKYQKGGIYPWAKDRIIPALKEITRAVGAPDVLISCYQVKGVGLHKTGEAADFQAGLRGSKNVDAIDLHNRIAKYALENWDRLNIRYMAWDGYEYGGSWGGPERKRKQTTNYGGTDPWHKNHVHIDFLPGDIPGAKPHIEIGSAISGSEPNTKNYYLPAIDGVPGPGTYTGTQRFLRDRGFYPADKYVVDGIGGVGTWTELQKFLKKLGYFDPKPSGKKDMTTARAMQKWLTNTGHFKGKITAKPQWTKETWKAWQRYLKYAHKDTKVTPAPKSTSKAKPTPKKDDFLMALTDKEQQSLLDDNRKLKTATERNERRMEEMLEYLAIIATAVTDLETPGTLRKRVEQTNAAVGRAEKARQAEAAKEAEEEASE